jgi:hypothetical protein
MASRFSLLNGISRYRMRRRFSPFARIEAMPFEIYCVHAGEGVPCGVQLLAIYQTYEAAIEAVHSLILNKEKLNGDKYITRLEEIKDNVLGFWQVKNEDGDCDYDIVMITKEKVQISGYIQGA